MTTVQLLSGRVAVRGHRRGIVVCAVLIAATAICGVAGLCAAGDLPAGTVLSTLVGHGTRGDEFIVYTLRLPRMLCAVLVGLALGASGAIFQSLSRNPLASPDVIGPTMGSSVGAVAAITIWHASMLGTSLAALAGGVATAILVYVLSFRHGAQGYRLVLVGIGTSLALTAVVHYLLARVDLDQALTAQTWLTGSLNGLGWAQFYPLLVAVAILLPLALALTRQLNIMELGDDSALALGVRVERSRLALLLLGVMLVAVAVATAGPISFVALSAPQLARRLTRVPGAGVFAAALMGALLLVVGDWVAHYALGPELPVGIATGAVGGLYLAWLLFHEGGR